ncbi:MAG: hypothetical protein WA087_00935 [Candidatus Saccharimonadales bacterium]
MKITHHLGRFTTFFKESSLVIQLVIVTSAIGIIAGTATVAAMVVTPNNNEGSTNSTTSESSDVASDTVSQQSTSNEDEQTTDTDSATATPQANETTPQNNAQQNTPQDSSNNSKPETQPQTPAQPTYTDSYSFKANCSSSPQQTSTQMDSWGYNKCYSSSYTAWKVQEKFGTAPLNWGDPKNWLQAADNANISRGTTAKLHSVGIQTTGGAGWSVWIEAVNNDGTVDISYYNFNNNLAYGKQYSVSPSVFNSYIYFGE